MSSLALDPEETDRREHNVPSGYALADTYFASRFQQGGRTIYALDLSIPQLIATIPQPDPDKVTDGNRQISLPHAKAFSEYIRDRDDWICPSLLLRAPSGEFNFKTTTRAEEAGSGTDFGILEVPKYGRKSVNIIDGQHRILGFHLAFVKLEDDITKARATVASAKKDRDVPELIASAEKHLNKLVRQRRNLHEQRIGLLIVITDDPKDYKQIFVDIADNAKGIPRAVSVGFDSHRVVNRAFSTVIEHPLLLNKVNKESDRAVKNSPYLLGAKHVVDIIRTVQVGPGRRISRAQEYNLTDKEVAKNAIEFFDTLMKAFKPLQDIRHKSLEPEALRQTSLLGSVTMMRVLAGVWHELVHEVGESPDDVCKFFASLQDDMDLPLQQKWLDTGAFLENSSAPRSGQGDVKRLVDVVRSWYRG